MNSMSQKTRIDRDSLGEVAVPENAYYGPFTARAKKQYQITKLLHIGTLSSHSL